MRNYFIFQYEDLVSSKQKFRATVIFIPHEKIHSQNTLSQEISYFFQENSITEKLVVILPEYLDKESLKYFFQYRDDTFVRIPGKSSDYFEKSLLIYSFNSSGELELKFGNKPKNEKKFISLLLRSGSTTIFKNNGGLVESTPDHHFVFPSNKHSSKFLRTGNVLIYQSEIFFLAIQLLKHMKEVSSIYCDTSSINVLPYAVFELQRRFKLSFECPTVHSFSSYEMFESYKESFPYDSLILISASTSGNIVDRILNEKRAERSQIQVIYFLGPNEKYQNHISNVICNLTKDENFQLGELEFKTYNSSDKCELCSIAHSRPINIRSDVFLTVQPKVEVHLLKTTNDYNPKPVSQFVQKFRGYSDTDNVIKVFYKENDANADYEIYFDFAHLIENIEDEKFSKFKESLNRYIDKTIPANTKYILYLPDIASKKLAEYIVAKIPTNVNLKLIKLEQNFIDQIIEESGSLIIVASCISTGKKLLQISRLMRSRENINLVYFVGIYRPISEKFSIELINDLKKGKDKSDERPFISVEQINCSIQQVSTSWENEKHFFEKMLSTVNDESDKVLYDYINDRLDTLRKNKETRGLSDKVFLRKYNGENLYLRKNFAFWNFTDYTKDDISQSEVYFTISTLVTNLENNDINLFPSLKQTNYVRNILSPRNFHRFNDGIIQASLLRAGKSDFFSYYLDSESNLKMKEFLLSIIEKYNTEDGEALLEFLLAIGLKKLRLKREDLREVLAIAQKCENILIAGISKYIYNIV
ncbi:hypothetical protein LX87_05475 [Larkinella arboricola]|uniref:Uncharacterized protein n=1 Tax=Larkinella arboricola TaxID=643671 RepID=A0A327WKW3_LARAB|nr:hypothetical protein [Larkinella arboricola]RAJ90846.1 hypothetical protein LX87_05475 [Larkinella arboricola]